MTGGVCRIEVTDNGIGIAAEDQARLFTPFVRLHGVEEYPGIGLGLATVQKAVELMGGRVGVTSVPGPGSTFWIELSPEEGEHVRVLLIDDDPADRDLLARQCTGPLMPLTVSRFPVAKTLRPPWPRAASTS